MHLWAGCGIVACDLSCREVGAGGSGVQVYPQLHNEFESSLGYKDLISIKQTQNN